MKKSLGILFLIFISCKKTESPDIFIDKAIGKLENAETIKYDVSAIIKEPSESDTIKRKSSYTFKKVEYEPYLKYHYTLQRDSLYIYYKTAELTTVNEESKTITKYNFRDIHTVKKVVNWGGNQESIAGVIKALKNFKDDNTFTFLGKEILHGKMTYAYSATSEKNKDNTVNYFWFDEKNYNLVKLKTIETTFKFNNPQYRIYICDFSNIIYNPPVNENIFLPVKDTTYKIIDKKSDL